MAVKGNEMPAHMPQVKGSLAIIYAANPFGADHQSHEHDPYYTLESSSLNLERMALLGLTDPQPSEVINHEKARLALYTQWLYSFMDTADLCQFVYGAAWELFGPAEMVQLMRAVTGLEITLADIQRIGERRLNLLRLFNAREGVGREADVLPQRLFDEPLRGGPTDGFRVDRAAFDAALNDYYELAGWDGRTGNPTPAKLDELELAWAAA